VAVSVATAVAATAEVVAWKLPVLAPAAMLTVAGTVTDLELLARLIDAPPEPALADSVKVHVLEAPPTTVDGEQLTEEIVIGGGFTVRDDQFYSGLVKWTQDLLANVAGFVDRWIIDGGVVRGLGGTTWGFGFALRFLQIGNLQAYAFLFGFGVVLLLYLILFAS
jgi:hypothetical protein